jgi:hypothetical protein
MGEGLCGDTGVGRSTWVVAGDVVGITTCVPALLFVNAGYDADAGWRPLVGKAVHRRLAWASWFDGKRSLRAAEEIGPIQLHSSRLSRTYNSIATLRCLVGLTLIVVC